MKTIGTMLAILAMLVWYVAPPLCAGQEEGRTIAEVTDVRSESLVAIHVSLHSQGGASQVVPYCGEFNDVRYLCDISVRLQKHSASGWENVKCKCGVFGGPPPQTAAQLKAGKTETFTYQLNTNLFPIDRRTRYRLILETWPDLDAMKSRINPIEVESQAFSSP